MQTVPVGRKLMAFMVTLGCIILSVVIISRSIHQNKHTLRNCVLNTNTELIKHGTARIKKIAFWSPQWHDHGWEFIPTGEVDRMIKCPSQCVFSRNKSSSLDYDALLFYASDTAVRPKERMQNQVYIMFSDEPPYLAHGKYFKGPNFYNWTATYKSDSDVYIPFWHFEKKSKVSTVSVKNLLPQLNNRQTRNNSRILWMVSRCYTQGARRKYVNLLVKHVQVDIYGGCGKPCSNSHCFLHLAKSRYYKFYLAFENSACNEYISEKVARAFNAGLVPIVFGALSSKQYFQKLPPNSFIDTRNFSSPEHLAKYLTHLDSHEEEYLSFHAWRLHYRIVMADIFCSICNALHNTSMPKHKNVDWGKFFPKEDCNLNLVYELIGNK